MITEKLNTLKIHKLSQDQYDRELLAGNIDDNALYMTPLVNGVEGIVPIEKGGTGSNTAAGALTKLGITATASEINCIDGATGNIPAQINDIDQRLASLESSLIHVYSGETAPFASLGTDSDIYLMV